MIKKLKFRFILISLISVFVVLSATISSLNIYNYVQIENNTSNCLYAAVISGVDEFEPNPSGVQPPKPKDNNLMGEHYFVVLFNSDGTVNKSNFKHIFSLNETEGELMAVNLLKNGYKEGKEGTYRYLVTNYNNEDYVAVIDLKEKLNDFNRVLLTSIIVSFSAYIILALLILLASNIVFKTSQEADKKQKEFITNASHELKTPLTIISTDIDIIELDNGENEWSKSIKDQVAKLTAMTNQLVLLSRLDEANLSNYSFEDINLSSLLMDNFKAFKPSFISKNININQTINEDIYFKGNKYLLNELFSILFDNALKYVSDNGEVNIKMDKNKNKINIDFINDIDDESIDVNQLFERFYRSSNNKKEGSGIGLSIVKEIVELHRGKIKAFIENKKIRFNITF